MKKAYSKPELYYERYELSSNIAGNCATGLPVGEITQGSYTNCTVKVGDDSWMFTSEPNCNTEPSEDYGFCYEVYTATNMLWSS